MPFPARVARFTPQTSHVGGVRSGKDAPRIRAETDQIDLLWQAVLSQECHRCLDGDKRGPRMGKP
jgi:hypothetical protein